MPDLTIPMTTAQAARTIAAYRQLQDRQGNRPAEDATNAELWAHVKRVVARDIATTIRSMESQKADPELDEIT
jgi:hypothetical protein